MFNYNRFIVVDDDPMNNKISKFILNQTFPDKEVLLFTIPEKALEFMGHEYDKKIIPTILFLDINMPTLSGWEVLEKFKEFDQYIMDQFKIYILSSSVDDRDILKAQSESLISSFISKPISKEILKELFK